MISFTADLERVTEAVLQADARHEALGPAALALLLRRYVSTGRGDIRDALERGLTAALEAGLKGEAVARPFEGRTEYTIVLAEAAAFTDDDRMAAALLDAAGAIRAQWPNRGELAPALQSVAACLAAASVQDEAAGTGLIAAAVDELERVLGRAYRPGEALPRSLQQPDEPDGGLLEHVSAARALLAAHAATGRLPYPMLAEELMQFALRVPSDDVAARCEAARVLLRLAALHDDDEYRRAAVVADTDYRAAAERVLAALAPSMVELGAGAAVYGVAIDELLAVRPGGEL